MAAGGRHRVPPWELASRSSYRRWKDAGRGGLYGLKHHHAAFREYERKLASVAATHAHQALAATRGGEGAKAHPSADPELAKSIQDRLGPCVADIGIRFQQLAQTRARSRQNRVCLSVMSSLEALAEYVTSDALFKLLVSYSRLVNSLVYIGQADPGPAAFSLKVASHDLCRRLFATLEARGFEVSSENCLCLLESYIRLCAGYGQDTDGFCGIYKRAMSLLTSGKLALPSAEMDRLLLLMDRMGLYDRSFVEYYSDRMARAFDLFTEDQLGNFCRYMTRLPFVERTPVRTHVDLLRRSLPGTSADPPGAGREELQYTKRLPRHYRSSLLSRRSYEFKPKVDYSASVPDSEQERVLKGWDFRNSRFVRTLDRRLPYVLHQYAYFNLVDVAETLYVYGVRTELLPRFATELWKYLYTLKYGYPMKSLIVLSCLKQGDAATYGRLVRNIPAALCFSWSPELVAECLVACGSLGIRRVAVYNKLAEYLQRRVLYFRNAELVCRVFQALALAGVPQYGVYGQVVTLAESFPDWLHLRHLVDIARSSARVGMLEARLFKLVLSRLHQVPSCSVPELIPAVLLSRELALGPEDSAQFYRFVLEFLRSVSARDGVGYEDLLELLEGMAAIQARSAQVEELAHRVLSEAPEADVVRVLRQFSILGGVESRGLRQLLGEQVEARLGELEELELSGLIWDMLAVGFDLRSESLLRVVRRFNQLRPRQANTHLLTVVASLVRLGEASCRTWREFVRIVEGYRDLSWSPSVPNERVIRSVASTIRGSRTFVRQFPFTIDIAAVYESIEAAEFNAGVIGGEGAGGAGFGGVCAGAEAGGGNDVALFYYDRHENPFVLHIRPDGTHEQRFNFYWQTRRRILLSMGWKDTLTFSPNN